MNRLFGITTLCLATTLCTAIPAFSQSSSSTTQSARRAAASAQVSVYSTAPVVAFASGNELLPMDEALFGEQGENKNDPGYALYKDGYRLILDEEWKGARKKFSEVVANYPKSEYLDDARYWSAYALMHVDRTKALKEYESFLKEFPKSSYYDDAVADKSSLESSSFFVVGDDNTVTEVHGGKNGYTYVTVPDGKRDRQTVGTPVPIPEANFRRSEREMRRLERKFQRSGLFSSNVPPPGAAQPAPAPTPGIAFGFPRMWRETENLDEPTRLKIDALYALGESKEDEASFTALKDVALDLHQPRQLRIAAMDMLSNYKKFDVVPIFLDIARKDTNNEIQSSAVDFITVRIKDKKKSIETLVELFNTLPKDRREQREDIFYSIAEIGNERAVDFLAKIARSQEEYELRSEAIYYLGSIGGEKARAVLSDILRGK